MAQRKEVFQSKVLQKLYPAVPKLEKEPSPPGTVEALASKTFVKRKGCHDSGGGDAGQAHSAAKPGRRVYTVLPPPADYTKHSESLTLPHLENGNSAKDPSEESDHDSNDDLNREKQEDEAQQRKKRKRKRKSTVCQNPAQNAASPISEFGTSQCEMPVDRGGECISRNRKRKLKKKRHKEKLLSMGGMPRSSALEFTYQKDGEVEEEEQHTERRAVGLSDFLRTTLDTYMSDSPVHIDKIPLDSKTVENLLSSISSGCKPTSVLQQLCILKDYVEKKDTDKLQKALKELYSNSFMSEEETTAVTSLFQYWITDILPMQGDKTVRL